MDDFNRTDISRKSRSLRHIWRNARKAAIGFRGSEDGGMLVFALILVFVMILIGGMAIDFMRYEYDRTRIQALADTSALSAASLRRTGVAEVEAEEIVSDWFTKAGLQDSLVNVRGTGTLNQRSVLIDTKTRTLPLFLHMAGLEELKSVGGGEAIEARTNVEISLVVDISGSMEGSKLRALKDAAVEFVEELLDETSEERVSISLVPYNGQVNIGQDLRNRYNITDRHNLSYCVDLPSSSYNQTALSPSLAMRQHVFADTYNTSDSSNSWNTTYRSPEQVTNRWCLANSANQIRPLSNNPVQLASQINNLVAIGATSIDAGLRWGAALIDPSARPVVSSLAYAGRVPEVFEGRPVAYDDADTKKVIVLMTDGEHFPNEYVAAGYRGGASPIYKHTDGYYSIFHESQAGTRKFWVPHLGQWLSHRWAGRPCGSCTPTVPSGSGTAMTWAEVWAEMRLQWVANQFYRRALGGTHQSWIDRLRVREGTLIGSGPHEVSAMDQRLLRLCTSLKREKVMVFGIAFSAPAGGANLLRSCANDGRFIDAANDAELRAAFRSITRQIISLRLTQ